MRRRRRKKKDTNLMLDGIEGKEENQKKKNWG
jgi:hypothetical protein